MNWPDWWDWELDLTLDHLHEQMARRGFNEADLRDMLERATDCHEDDEFGRWAAQTTLDREPWEVIVEPQFAEQLLLVITAYKKEPL